MAYSKIPLQDVQKVLLGNGGQENSCFLCGKLVKNPIHFVHYTTNGDLVNTDADISVSQGFFPIGADCKRRLPKDFIFPSPQK